MNITFSRGGTFSETFGDTRVLQLVNVSRKAGSRNQLIDVQ